MVQALPSLQGSTLLVAKQPVTALQPSVVQGFLSSHGICAPAVQTPATQLSPPVQTLPSALQDLPSAWFCDAQAPEAGTHTVLAHAVSCEVLHVTMVFGSIWQTNGSWLLSQYSVPLHRLPSSLPAQSASAWHAHRFVPGAHAPAAHVSPLVHALPSEQTPSVGACPQPTVGSQPSAVHGLLSLHVADTSTGKPEHPPLPSHTSPAVQALPSEHALVLGVWLQPLVGSQASSVQGFPSLHVMALPAVHAPFLQASPRVQTEPSLHVAALALCLQPLMALQVSDVQSFPSLQSVATPGRQTPPWQLSPRVQTEPSSQLARFGVLLQPLAGRQASSVHGLPSLHWTAGPG